LEQQLQPGHTLGSKSDSGFLAALLFFNHPAPLPSSENPPMDIKTVTLNRRSKNITEGKSRAPNRSMYYAMGYQEADFHKPMIGVANGHSTITPCNSGL
jgi:dihydroxy-acid dehydratase